VAPGCAQVWGVDSSRPALEVAEQNAALNHPQLKDKDKNKEIEWIEANAFDLLKDYSRPASVMTRLFSIPRPRQNEARPGCRPPRL